MAETNSGPFGGFDRRFADTSKIFADNGSASTLQAPELVGPSKGTVNWKTVEFWMGAAKGDKTYRGRQSWRTMNLGGIDFASNPVANEVILIPETTEIVVEGGIKYNDENEEVSGGAGGILDAIKAGVEIFTGTTAIPEWGAQTFDGLDPMGLGSEYTFTFNFGKFGLYNAFEEVVKPILALTLFFGVEAEYKDEAGTWNNHLLNSAAATIISPQPTKAQFLAERVKGAFGTLKSVNWDDLTGGSLADTLARANSLIQSALAAGAHNVSTSSAYRNLYMSWGRFTFGPLIYKKIKYTFDQKNLDTNGWPTKGTFTISDIKSMRKATTQALVSPLVRGV